MASDAAETCASNASSAMDGCKSTTAADDHVGDANGDAEEMDVSLLQQKKARTELKAPELSLTEAQQGSSEQHTADRFLVVEAKDEEGPRSRQRTHRIQSRQ